MKKNWKLECKMCARRFFLEELPRKRSDLKCPDCSSHRVSVISQSGPKRTVRDAPVRRGGLFG